MIRRVLWERVNIDRYNYKVFFNATKRTNIKHNTANYNKCISTLNYRRTAAMIRIVRVVITAKNEQSRKTLCDNITTITDKLNNTNLIFKRF